MSRSPRESEALRNEIRRYRIAGYTGEQIQGHLKITKSTFDYNMLTIYKEDKEYLRTARQDLMESEILLAKKRLERTIQTCEDIRTADNSKPMDKISAGYLLRDTSLDILRLLHDGFNILVNDEANKAKQNVRGLPERSDLQDQSKTTDEVIS